jgi:hypothetical protein
MEASYFANTGGASNLEISNGSLKTPYVQKYQGDISFVTSYKPL